MTLRQLLMTLGGWIAITAAVQGQAADAVTWHPTKPIKIVVYTGPGGLIDATARKFAEVAARHTKATWVVENKPGAGGIVAMQRVLAASPDGHTLLACTKSNISVAVAANREGYLEQFDWLALLLIDPECVIARAEGPLNRWSTIVADARQKEGRQIWVGPALGGLDHVTAVKIWEKSAMWANWIPFKSGGLAQAALLGDQAVAYVGNPGDVVGKDKLRIVAVSSSQRLAQFPDAPTFGELGLQGLDDEYMWRGLALRKGCPPEARQWYAQLFQQVTADPRWREFWESDGLRVVQYGPESFLSIIEQDRQEFRHYLTKLEILRNPDARRSTGWIDARGRWVRGGAIGLLLLTNLAIVCGLGVARRRCGPYLVPLGLLNLCAVGLYLTWLFPRGDRVGPATVPQLWMTGLAAVAMIILRSASVPPQPAASDRRPARGVLVICLLLLYLLSVDWLGYYVSSSLFLVTAMYLLGVQRLAVLLAVSIGWSFFSYLTFAWLLYVPLPLGRLWEMLLS